MLPSTEAERNDSVAAAVPHKMPLAVGCGSCWSSEAVPVLAEMWQPPFFLRIVSLATGVSLVATASTTPSSGLVPCSDPEHCYVRVDLHMRGSPWCPWPQVAPGNTVAPPPIRW